MGAIDDALKGLRLNGGGGITEPNPLADARFKALIDQSLRRHWECFKTLTGRGAWFLEYGNSIMEAMFDAGVRELSRNGRDKKDGFIFPDFIEAITGPELFDRGYGPFRWVCLSGRDEDLARTDAAALECIDPNRSPQDRDNYNWIRHAGENNLVIGTRARMLYQDASGKLPLLACVETAEQRMAASPTSRIPAPSPIRFSNTARSIARATWTSSAG